jgi:hypothetical protein
MRKNVMGFTLAGQFYANWMRVLEQQDDKIYISYDTYGAGQIAKVALAEFVELPIPEKMDIPLWGGFMNGHSRPKQPMITSS